MIGSWNIQRLQKPKQFFAFARSYLEASSILCRKFEGDDDILSYPQASVILFLAYHATELFLKGAILSHSHNERLHHNIDQLKETYEKLYSGPEFYWNPPFRTEYLGFSPEDIEPPKKDTEPLDQVYRYPTDIKRDEWRDVYAFDPESFQDVLNSISSDFDRLEPLYPDRTK